MSRDLRIEFPGALYHVMSRGHNGSDTFLGPQDFLRFIAELQKLVELNRLILHAYGLMDNHYHLLCETPEAQLSRWMQILLSRYSTYFNLRHQRTGRLWQSRYKALLVEDGAYFLTVSRYIHLNAPSANIVAVPEDYPWSSYSAYLKPGTSKIVCTQKTLSVFPDRADYISFVKAGLTLAPIDPFEHSTAGLVFGSDRFLKKVIGLVEDRPNDPEIPSLRELREIRPHPTVSQLHHWVEELFGDHSACQRRRILVYVASRHTILQGKEIAKLVGLHPSTVSSTIRSIENKVRQDVQLSLRLAEIVFRVERLTKENLSSERAIELP